MFMESKVRWLRRAENLTAICERPCGLRYGAVSQVPEQRLDKYGNSALPTQSNRMQFPKQR
jgi:hypothetical protein